ncbi:MAG: glutathione S-transferase [Betaproteobacteria bacterium HGW-Betaproteobacteria-14]|nr:MAG: glutathione S-transferase [Betaproteobacteria bacterium HGW-Betaproteobacteria-14]
MQLIGMLDSPYVRRTAISLECLGLPFAHQPVSVFSTFDQFRGINPVVKAPTLVCDDGEVLMDSSLILQYAEARCAGRKSLWPQDAAELQHDLRAVGLALAACEKSVQIVYERNLRPQAFQYAPWLARVTGQLRAAYAGLEQEVGKRRAVFVGPLHQAAITTAVAWQFTQSMLAEIVAATAHPALADLSARLEKTPEFLKYPPTGPGVVAPAN